MSASDLQKDTAEAFDAKPVRTVYDGATPRRPPGSSADDEVVTAWKRDGWECEHCGHFTPTGQWVGAYGCPDCATVRTDSTGTHIEWPHKMRKVEKPAATTTLGELQGDSRELVVDYVDDVTVEDRVDSVLGEIQEVTVTTNTDRYAWNGQHSQAIFDVLDEVGISRPFDSRRHGVKFDGNEVSVTAYRQTGAVADGGVSVFIVDGLRYFGYAVPPMLAMSRILVDLGEEWYGETDISGVASVDVSLYNDGTDAISDTEDLSDITTEPSGASFARQTNEISFEDLSGDWGFDNDNQESFDTSDSSQSVESYFHETSFQADDTSDGSPTDHLLLTGALSQTYDLSSVDTLNINAGTAGVTVS